MVSVVGPLDQERKYEGVPPLTVTAILPSLKLKQETGLSIAATLTGEAG